MYGVVRRYENEAEDVIDQIRTNRSSLEELMRGIDGFVAYHLVDTGDRGLVTIGVFQDRAGGDESTRVAAKFVADTMPGSIPNPPTVMAGEVVVSA